MVPALLLLPIEPIEASTSALEKKTQAAKSIADSNQSYWNSRPEPSLLHRSLYDRPILALSALKYQITLQNGHKILDACGGATVECIGHGNQKVVAAMTAQASSVAYVHTLSYTTSSAEDLTTLLIGNKTGNLSKAFFVGSGSEAVDGAM